MSDVIELFMECCVDLIFGMSIIGVLFWWLNIIIGG